MTLKIFTFSVLITLITSCFNKNEIIMQNPNITSNNIVDEILKKVRHYNYEPMYYIEFSNQSGFFELLVNDIPVYKNFKEPAISSAITINHAIFKSGTQRITYRLYPAEDINRNSYTTLKDETKLELIVSEADNTYNRSTGKDLIKYTLPVVDKINNDGFTVKKFSGSGKTFYEGSFVFEANIPYKLDDFDNAQDLTKIDNKILERKLISEYNKIIAVYQNKDYDGIAKTFYQSMKNQYISEYGYEKDLRNGWNEILEIYKNPTLEMQPIENYKMTFFANGKLVALINESNDFRLRKQSMLWSKYKVDGRTRAEFSIRYFYIPQGKSEFEIY